MLDRTSSGGNVDYLNEPGIDRKLRQSAGASTHYYLQDHLGSTVALTDAAGAVTERQQYEPFGATSGSALSRFGYTGRELDSQTGLMYYRARWYDPQQGRFITQDPIGLAGGLNQYAYAANNPLTFFDPSGLSWTTFKQGLAEGGIDGFWQGLKYGLIFGAMSGLSAASGGTLLPAIMEVLTLVLGAAAVAAIAQQVYDLFSGNYCPDELHYRIGYLIGSVAGALVGGKVGSAAGYRAVTPRTPGSTVGMNGGGAEGEGEEISNPAVDNPKTGSGLKDDVVKPIRDAKGNIVKEFPPTAKGHGVPDIIGNYAGAAQKFTLRSGADLYQIERSYNGVAGRFEWIIDHGNVTHRMFVQGGKVNGVPIKQ